MISYHQGGVPVSVDPLIRIATRAARRPSQALKFGLSIDFSPDEGSNMLSYLYDGRSK